jgi:hypothetical protein
MRKLVLLIIVEGDLQQQSENHHESARDLNRRDFLKISILAGASASIGILTLGAAVINRISRVGEWLTTVGFLRRIEVRKRDKILQQKDTEREPLTLIPGYVELRTEAYFLPERYGTEKWLEAAATVEPVKTIAVSVINDIDSNPDRYKTVGHTLEHILEISRNILLDEFPNTARDVLETESVHLGLIAAASIFNRWFYYDEVFGIDTTKWGDPKDMDQQRWGTYGFAKKWPNLFPADNGSPIELNGKDKLFHFMNWLLVCYEILYVVKHDTAEAMQFTWVLPPEMLSAAVQIDRRITLNTVVRGGGFFYEAKSSFHPYAIKSLLIGPNKVGMGVFDPEVQHDYAANNAAIDTAIALFNGYTFEVYDLFKDPRLSEVTHNPGLPLDIAKKLDNMAREPKPVESREAAVAA